MGRAAENMPEMTADELLEWRERMTWQEYEAPAQPTVAIAGWLDVPGMWSPAAIAEYCNAVGRIDGKRITEQRHISHYNEYAEIAAQVHAATNDDPDPHGDLSWRDEMGLPY